MKAGKFGMWVGSTSIALAIGSVHAQIEIVEVTAQKRTQNMQDVGIAVSAFSGDDLESLGVDSAEHIADSVSGVQVYNWRGKGQPSFVIRGIGTQDFAPNSAPTAAVYIDEVYLGSNIVTGSQIFDVERVEVLKGPQGTLFGRNTTGGAVSYTAKRPGEELELMAQVGYGNYETLDSSWAISGGISDRIRMRLSGKYSDQGEGYYDNRFTPDQNPFGPAPRFQNFKSNIGEDTNWAARLLTEVDIGDDALLLLNIHGGKRDSDTLPVTPIGYTTIPGSGGVCQVSPTGGQVSDPRFCGDAFGYSDQDGDEYTVNNDYVGDNEESNAGASARIEWSVGDIDITSITAFESAEKLAKADSEGSPFFVFDVAADTDFKQFSQELRLTSTPSDDLFWIAGLYYGKDDIEQVFCGDLNLLVGLGAECRNEFTQKTDSTAVYGQAEYSLSDTLKVTMGLRYTNESRDFTSINTFTDEFGVVRIANFGSGPGDQAIIDDSVSTSDLSGRLGLDYFLNDDTLLYASFSRGFKSGGYDGDFSFTRQQLEPYGEEIIKAYEFGWKTTLLDNTLRFNGAVFHYDYSSPQTRVQRISSAGLPFNQLINLDKADVLGFETDITWAPTDRFEMSASMTLLDTELQDDSSDPALALFDGNDLPLAAKESFTLLARYELPVTDTYAASVQVDGKYNGEYELNAENLGWLTQDSYFLVNSRVSLYEVDGHWELAFWGKNLTDETFAVGSYALFGAFPVSYNTPKTFGVSVRYEYW